MAPPRVSFFTAGDRTPHGTSYIITNQCYVQYIAPRAETIQAPPLLFIHGGGLNGSSWESTPDRRPGWAILAAQQGRHIYIMDGVDSGRSQRAPDQHRSGDSEWRDAKQIWERFRFGPIEGWEDRTSYEDSAFDARHLDALVASQSVRRRSTDDLERRGIGDVLRELAVDGPIDVVAHSHGAALLVQASEDIKHLLNKVALVEPGTTTDAKDLMSGLKPLIVWGDYIHDSKIWKPFWDTFNDVDAEKLVLKDVGIVGNSHFPMSDRNSNQVWAKISSWLQA